LQNQKNSEKRNSKEKDKKLQTSELKEDVQNNLNNTANIDEKLKLFSLHIQVINDILKMRARIAELERILSETSRIRKYHATENVFGKNTKDNKKSNIQLEGSGKIKSYMQILNEIQKKFYIPVECDPAFLFLDNRTFMTSGKFIKLKHNKTQDQVEYQIFLFNDLLIVGLANNYEETAGKLLLIAMFPLNYCIVRDVEDTESFHNNTFEIIRTDVVKKVSVVAASQKEKDLWISIVNQCVMNYPFQNFYLDDALLEEL